MSFTKSAEMLYIFHVNMGEMRAFGISMALEPIHVLKAHIEKEMGIPVEKQVLLISGGDCLDGDKAVCSYASGTDSNPIFLFTKPFPNDTLVVPAPAYAASDTDILDSLIEAQKWGPHFNTISNRTKLAELALEKDQEIQRTCEDWIHDQHLQQQAWSAVSANLDDINVEFKHRVKAFLGTYEDYLNDRSNFLNFMSQFKKDLPILGKIPLLPALTENDKYASEASASKIDTNPFSEEIKLANKEISLLEWLKASEKEHFLDDLYESCLQIITQLDERIFNEISYNSGIILDILDKGTLQSVQGIEKRLSGLDDLMHKLKQHVNLQMAIRDSIKHNKIKADDCKDKDILRELCESHKNQLSSMYQNHSKILSWRDCIFKAKIELIRSLHVKLIQVVEEENKIGTLDQQLVIYHENLRKLRRNLEVLQQVHIAPSMYLCAVVEVVRRKQFSQSFLLWATELACHLLTIYNDEVNQRKEFKTQFDSHFLKCLFNGMDDQPPPFATEAPSLFDAKLPKITEEDIEMLRQKLPQYREFLKVPETSAITNFFSVKSIMKEEDRTDESKVTAHEQLTIGSDIGLIGTLNQNVLRAAGSEPCLTTAHGLPHLKDLDKGCESETDTEEFEKVGQSPLEPPRPGTQDASTFTEDNLQISKSEHEKLKSQLVELDFMTKQATEHLKLDLMDMKDKFTTEKNILQSTYDSFATYFKSLEEERNRTQESLIETIKNDHAQELASLKNCFSEKEEEANNVRIKNIVLEQKLQKALDEIIDLKQQISLLKNAHSLEVEELQGKLREKEQVKEKLLRETVDQLNRVHKAELENIRSRFKLMTMERSPSDTSLEKIGDFTSIPNHETLLSQMTETFELEKEKILKQAVAAENEKCSKLMDQKIAELKIMFESEKAETVGEAVKEKDMQIEVLRERENKLNLECIKYKSTIQQLTEADSDNAELSKKIDTLLKENSTLKEALEKYNQRKSPDMTASVAVIDANTSPIRTKKLNTKNVIPKLAKLDSCRAGDQVLVMWDHIHRSFRVAQDSRHLYFLHSDYLQTLNLEVVNGQPNKTFVYAEVIDKDFCHARKPDNRYKVAKGTKFFRVKVKLASNVSQTQSMCHPKPTTSDSQMFQSQTFTPTYMSEPSTSAMTSTSEPSTSAMTYTSEPSTSAMTYTSEPSTSAMTESFTTSPLRKHSVIAEDSEVKEASSLSRSVSISENPEEIIPEGNDKNFYEDSGVVEGFVEEAAIALESDKTICENESDDRSLAISTKLSDVHIAANDGNWLGMMISRVFGKNDI